MNATQTTLTYLQQQAIIVGLPTSVLAEMATKTRTTQFQDGHVFFREGDPGDAMYIVVAGQVEIIKGVGDDLAAAQVIAVRGPGEMVGEMSLFEDEPRFAAAVCKGPVEAIVIPFEIFVSVIGQNFASVRQLLAQISKKLRQAQEARYSELLRRQEELEGLCDLQQGFLGVVHHELMTPIVGAKFSLDVLLQAKDTLTQAETDKLTTGLAQSITEAERRVRTLVEYASLIQVQEKMNLRKINFADAAQEAVAAYQPQLTSSITLVANIKNEDLWLWGDYKRLVEALGHLLDNAFKFGRPGRKNRIRVEVWGDKTLIHCEVSDQGRGIPADRLTEIWRPFVQMSHTFTRGIEGLGLGLALTQYIVKAHGGEVRAESRPGRGSKFRFSLPRIVQDS